MNNMSKIVIFSLIFIFALGVVSAADVNDTSDVSIATESISTPTTNIIEDIASETEEEEIPQSTSITVTESNYDNLNTYISTYDEVIFDGTFSGKTVNIGDDVIITSTSGTTFTNSHFNVLANNVVIKNMSITNTDTGSAILIDEYNNTQILSNSISVTSPTTPGEAVGIKFNTSNNQTVDGNNITITGNAQYRWEDLGNWIYIFHLYNAGLVVDNSSLINITNNKIISTTTTTDYYGTNEGMNLRNSKNLKVDLNNVTVTGGDMAYGITIENVNTSNVTNNKIDSTTGNYANAIQLVEVKNSTVTYNNLTVSAHNTTTPHSYETFAYGIYMSTNYGDSQTYGNDVSYNNIQVNATISFGIEGYIIENNTLDYNNITAIGNNTLGIGLYNSSNNNLTNNILEVTGETKTLNAYAYEQITPETTGVKIVGAGNSTNNILDNNTITVTDTVASIVYAVILNANNNNVTNNYLVSTNNELVQTNGTDSVADNGSGNVKTGNTPVNQGGDEEEDEE